MDFFDRLKNEYGIHLNTQQQLAVCHGKGPALVLAGPGSGKTTVITARAAYLIIKLGVDPSCLLTVTYNKAAQIEMQKRFNRIFQGTVQQKVHFSTMHSFCYSVLRDYERQRGQRFKLIEGAGDNQLSKPVLLKNIYREIEQSLLNDEELDTLMNEIGLVKNRMLSEQDIKQEAFETKHFMEVFKAYEACKKKNLWIDFDDMLTYANSILRRCPDILEGYRKKISYYQIDEAQDLSKIQHEILKLLVEPDKNIFLVADDDQSIYGFRGAEPRYILDIQKRYPECSVILLEHNYRSSRNIVEVSSRFIKSNQDRMDKKHYTQNANHTPPYVVSVQDAFHQIDFVLDRIKSLLKKDPDIKIAVLYRNNLSSITFAEALERAQIQYVLRQNKVHFYKHWFVQDILAFLKFALDPFDVESFQRIYYKINHYISKSMMEAIMQNQRHTVLDTLPRLATHSSHKKQLLALKKDFKKLSEMKSCKALDYIEEHFKYFGHVKEYCDNTGLSFSYLYRLFDLMKTIAASMSSIRGFLERLEELENMMSKESGIKGNAVVLSTLHASKGLEFDAVFMVDLLNDEIPGQYAVNLSKRKSEGQLEEERRLFYVGMTRAKALLFLIAPEKRNGTIQPRSTFISEVMHLLNEGASDRLREGMYVNHKKYGRGILSKIEQNSGNLVVILVDFQGKTRSLDLATCLECGIISFSD